MSATQFICPNNDHILIRQCLSNCPHHERCLAKPILQAVANSVQDRMLGKLSVTELLSGTRELYYKKTTDYAVEPQSVMLALNGSGMHLVAEENSEDFITELRLENDLYTGQIDCWGNVLGNNKKTLLDYKVTSSYKAMLALGYYQAEELTGEVFKTGARKGQPKTKKVWKSGGVRKVFDYAVQLNAYRILMEQAGYQVDEMLVQLFVRDVSTRVAKERNITKPIYLIKINKISDRWMRRYNKLLCMNCQKHLGA